MSYSALINDNTDAQVSENTLKSITNQTNVNKLTRAQISVGESPYFIERYGNYLYVANSGSNTVSVIDPNNNTLIGSIPVGKGPYFIHLSLDHTDPYKDYIYVANILSNTVSVIDPNQNNTVVKNITVGGGPIFIGTFGNYSYVANYDSNTVSIIDPNQNNTVIKNITTVGKGPYFIERSEDYSTNPIKEYLYVANYDSNTVSIIDPNQNNTVIKNITTVGKGPNFIERSRDYLYIANSGSNTVSVIDPNQNNTVVKNITVGGGPNFVETFEDYFTNPIKEYLYVANYGSNSTSVIDLNRNNTVVKNITTVGEGPNFIHLSVDHTYPYKDYIYVTNYFSNTTSVIDPIQNNTVVKNITVGGGPKFIETFGNAIYVANYISNTVSLVDTLTKEEVAGMKFDIKPVGAGRIICDKLDVPRDRFLYVTSGAKCVAKPTTGFEFSSWTQNLPRNTNVTISAATPSDWLGYPLTSLYEAFTDDPAATLSVDKFGTFTAYFKALPSPVPPEFTASLITTIVAALAGSLLIPLVLSWIKSKKQTSKLDSFHIQMARVYADDKVNKKDIKVNEKDIEKLNKLSDDISDSYAVGEISNEQYTHIKNEVSTEYLKIFKNRIESITERNIEDLGKINNNITDAYSNGKLSNEHYVNLKNEISNVYQKIFKKKIESLTNPNTEAINKIKNDITDAYSDGKITELHYNLLIQKISDMLNNK